MKLVERHMKRNMRTGVMGIAILFGSYVLAGQASAQQAPQDRAGVQAGARRQASAPVVEGTCPSAGGRGPASGLGAGASKKRVLAWADSRNGIGQHEYVSYALAQLQRMGYDTGAYDVII